MPNILINVINDVACQGTGQLSGLATAFGGH